MRCVTVVALLVLLIALGGCRHHQTAVPGVLDMRTDGRAAQRATTQEPLPPQVARRDLDGLLQGKGVLVNGSDVTIEDRHYWVMGSVPIYNQSPRPELVAALSLTGALTDVEVGEDYSVVDIGGAFVARYVPMFGWILGWVTPSWTFYARGTLVDAGRAPPRDDRAPPLSDPVVDPLGAQQGVPADKPAPPPIEPLPAGWAP